MIVVSASHFPRNMSDETGARRWAVVIAAFFTQFIICGITYSMGIFHVVFQDVYNHDHFDTSWAGSILVFMTALTSVAFRFVPAMLGCRLSIMLGGLISAAGLGLSMVVTDLFHLYITYGVLTGIGFGLACTPSIMAVERYFNSSRFQALSIVVGGVGAGIMTFPIAIRYLLDYFAWRGTLLILAGVALNLCVCGAIMKPDATQKKVRLLPLLSSVALKNSLFHGMCIANLFWSFGSSIIYMFLPAYALEIGTDFDQCIMLITCVGMSSFTSRMIFAFMGHNSTLDDLTSFLCAVGLGVVVTGTVDLLFDSYTGQVGYTILFGFYSGFWTTFLSQVSSELIGPEYIALGNGYLCFMISIGSLLGGPLASLLIHEESFKYAFYLAGTCLLMSSTTMVMFKYRQCGPPPDPKYKMVDDEQKIKFIDNSTGVVDHEQTVVQAVITTV